MKTKRTSLLVAAFLLCAVGLFHATNASANQCVRNNGGFTMHVYWYRVAGLRMSDVKKTVLSDTLRLSVTELEAPLLTQTIPPNVIVCTESSARLAALITVLECAAVSYAGAEAITCIPEQYRRFLIDQRVKEGASGNISPEYCSMQTAAGIGLLLWCKGDALETKTPIIGVPIMIINIGETTGAQSAVSFGPDNKWILDFFGTVMSDQRFGKYAVKWGFAGVLYDLSTGKYTQ